MKEKFGQWWLDVAKYIFTGVILSSVFSDVEEKVYLYIGGIVLVIIFVFFGLYLIKSHEKDKDVERDNIIVNDNKKNNKKGTKK